MLDLLSFCKCVAELLMPADLGQKCKRLVGRSFLDQLLKRESKKSKLPVKQRGNKIK